MRITCCVCLLLVTVFAAGCAQPREKPTLKVWHSGNWSPGIFSSEFVLKVWHQHPGTVHNGVMHIKVTFLHASEENTQRTFSFDTWPPNEENARTFRFERGPLAVSPIVRFDIDVQTEETVEGGAFTAIWAISGWVKEADKAEFLKQFEALQQQSEGASPATQ